MKNRMDSWEVPLSQSINCVFTRKNEYICNSNRNRLKRNVASDLFFFAGSLCYFIDAISDMNYINRLCNGKEIFLGVLEDNSYTILSLSGASFCLLHALVDIYQPLIPRGGSTDESSEDKPSYNWCKVLSSFLFGIGAMIDIFIAIYISDEIWMNHAYLISAYLWLMSSLLALGSIEKCICSSSVMVLRLFGDALFMAGSGIDVSVGYVSHPEIMAAQALAKWGCVSSGLWCLDSILYLLANAIVMLGPSCVFPCGKCLIRRNGNAEQKILPQTLGLKDHKDAAAPMVL